MKNGKKSRKGLLVTLKASVDDVTAMDALVAANRLPGAESVKPVAVGEWGVADESWLFAEPRRGRARPPLHMIGVATQGFAPAERKLRRRVLEISLSQMAKALGCSASLVSNMEGEGRPVHHAWLGAYDWMLENSRAGRPWPLPAPEGA